MGQLLSCICGQISWGLLVPKRYSKLWRAAVAKWVSRAYEIAAAMAPFRAPLRLYNSRGATTLSFISQSYFLPRDVHQKEMSILFRVLHIPHNSFSCNASYNLDKWGSRSITTPMAMAAATLMRAALSTLTTWRSAAEMLGTSAEECLPFVQVLEGCQWNRH